MTKSYQPYCTPNTRRVSDWIIGVCKETSGAMLTAKCRVDRPMPGMVILVHGVNDIGEAYPSQEQGIIAGLNQRLGRIDMQAHQWQDAIIQHYGHRDKATGVYHNIPSPVIPFYWGYKPVDHATWINDQARYAAEIDKLNAILPYDSYRENDPDRLHQFGLLVHQALNDFDIDCFGNVLVPQQARGGGPFANATTNIPDMLGPGMQGFAQNIAQYISVTFNKGDYSHAIYQAPHRIYQFFAAQRLAELILDVRKNEDLQQDTINIVAHSQGTIITMLANMLVKQQGFNPADCVIFNNSPYAMDDNPWENGTPGRHQSSHARQQTFKNFCALMASNPKAAAEDESHTGQYRKIFTDKCCATINSPWNQDPTSQRNNFGKVYNYFCPQDSIVSLRNVQGIGWRGIPDNIASQIANLRQRVFYHRQLVGAEYSLFQVPASQFGDYHYDWKFNVRYDYHDVNINGALLPEPFTFYLEGYQNPEPYYQALSARDAVFAYAAKQQSSSMYVSRTITLPDSVVLQRHYAVNQLLSDEDLLTVSRYLQAVLLYATKTPGEGRQYMVYRGKTLKELMDEKMHNPLVEINQHSAIVNNTEVSAKAVAYDLAIGHCDAFFYDQGRLWNQLMLKADWRNRDNGNKDTRIYYRSGELNEHKTKQYMHRPDEILPKGEFGVFNEYTANSLLRYDTKTQRNIPIAMIVEHFHTIGQIIIGMDTKKVDLPQWQWPTPLTKAQIQRELAAERTRQLAKEQP